MADPKPEKIDILKARSAEYERQVKLLNGVSDAERKSALIGQEILNNQKQINLLVDEQVGGSTKNVKNINILIGKEKDLQKEQKEVNKQLENQLKKRQLIVDLAKGLAGQLKIGYKYLQDQDKVIKSTVLNLGMSGQKAVAMRDAFEKSAGYVTRLGGSIGDIGIVMQGYADETGRARALSAEMVNDIIAIGKGTGLGVQEATRLGAQFEIMGIDARATNEYVQGIVDTSERMGVNTTKVLKSVNDNFKRLNTYTFQQGTKGMAEMAMYAEKFKVDITSALNAADIARSLDGAIDLAAQLQVMGGEFARTDPFEMLFLSRNDPAKFTEKIADMTKGVVSFRKVTDSAGKTVFEKFISPADRDRLAQVAKSLGMEAGALTEIAQRQAEIQKMRTEMRGMGLSDEQKKLIEGAAIYETSTGKFQVKIGETTKYISQLTETQAKSFVKEQKSLEERAKQAMTFNEVFQATIETLKAALLPMLKTINKVLVPLSKVADGFSKIAGSTGGWIKAGGILLAAAGAWKGASLLMNHTLARYMGSGMGKFMNSGKAAVGNARMAQATGSGKSGLARQRIGIGKGAARAGAGKAMMGAGAGIGAAAVGVGAGIGLAAVGISKLAEAMAKLDKTGIDALPNVILSLGAAFIPFAIALAVVGTTAGVTAGPLMAFGAAVTLIGVGIGVAAAGVGFMAKGFGEMFESSKGAGDDMLKIGGGLAVIAASLGAVAITLPAAIGLSMVINKMGKNAPALETVGASLEKIKAGLTGSREDYEAIAEAIKTISGTKLKRNNAISQMADLMNKPLKVEFDKGKVNLHNNITLDIDGQKFMRKTFNQKLAISSTEDLKNNKGGNNHA